MSSGAVNQYQGDEAARRNEAVRAAEAESAGRPEQVASNREFAEHMQQNLREADANNPVEFNLFDQRYNRTIPDDNAWNRFWNRVNVLPDLLGTGDPSGDPEGLITAPMYQHPAYYLEKAGLPMDQQGNVSIPNTEEGGTLLAMMNWAEVGVSGSFNGQLDFEAMKQDLPLSPDFVRGYEDTQRQILTGQGIAALQTLITGMAAASSAGSAPSQSQLPPGQAPGPRRIDPAGSIQMGRDASGTYRPFAFPDTGAGGAVTPSPSGQLARPPANNPSSLVQQTPTVSPNLTVPNAATPAPPNLASPGQPPASGNQALTPPQGEPGTPPPAPTGDHSAGMAQRMAAEQAALEAQRTRDLDQRSAANPIATVSDEVSSSVGRFSWDDVGRAATEHNANAPSSDVMVRVPVDRNYGGDAQRREVGMLRGDPMAIENQVNAMQQQGQVPADFDLPGAARQTGLDWGESMQASRDARAYHVAAENPINLFGNETYAYPDAQSAISATMEFNASTEPGGDVAIYAPINVDVSSGNVSGQGLSHQVYVGDPGNARGFYDAMRDQGRIPDDVSFDDVLQMSGIHGSFDSRVGAAAQMDQTPVPAVEDDYSVDREEVDTLIRSASELPPLTTQEDLQEKARLLDQMTPAERRRTGNVMVELLANTNYGELPSRIDDIHSHEGPRLSMREVRSGGFGSYDANYIGNRPEGISDEEWLDRVVNRFIDQSSTGDTVFFPVAPRFAQPLEGTAGERFGGDAIPDYYLARDARNKNLLGTVEFRDGRAINTQSLPDRAGNPRIVPFNLSIEEFESLIGRQVPSDVTAMEFVTASGNHGLHYDGAEIDESIARAHAKMIRHERDVYDTDVIASHYVMGLTAGNPRADDSAHNVFNALNAANRAEQSEGISPGSLRMMWGETNLSKEMVHTLGGQTPLIYNTPEELANLNQWAGAMSQTGMPVIIHMDSGTPAEADLNLWGGSLAAFRTPSNVANVDKFITFANENPDTDIIWAHAGLGYTVQMPLNYTDTLQRVLDEAPNVKIDISWDAIHPYIKDDAAAWAKLIGDNPDRFIWGSDTIATSQNDAAPLHDGTPNSRYEVARSLQRTGLIEELDRLDPNLKEAVFSSNYQDTVPPGVQRANEFRLNADNREWLERGGPSTGEPPPMIWTRDSQGNYRDELVPNPAAQQ
ncbi:hypothetical protein J2T57_003486 [Natronocella acetinitrilica]|uniref:Amidohydrolase family protein n=1 Tax=Natronocella acetinitrilica TaxID=414046 RepID=A0AAE3KC07_9GAMM|nr:hypothetical protein [Natronocella acetinitrilica]MCP1676325.1 hypothetical protein [Natronocella acetinitrilica]